MARLELAPEVLDDFERFTAHLLAYEVDAGPARVDELILALQVLATSPLIGRPMKGGQRELVIGRDAQGYVARYRYVPNLDTVFILAVRAQREARFKRRR